jgi:hypothetical protein
MRVAVLCLGVLGLMMTLGCKSESSDTVFPVTGVISAYTLTTNLTLPQAGIIATGTVPVNAKISDEKNLFIKIGGVQVGPAAVDGQPSGKTLSGTNYVYVFRKNVAKSAVAVVNNQAVLEVFDAGGSGRLAIGTYSFAPTSDFQTNNAAFSYNAASDTFAVDAVGVAATPTPTPGVTPTPTPTPTTPVPNANTVTLRVRAQAPAGKTFPKTSIRGALRAQTTSTAPFKSYCVYKLDGQPAETEKEFPVQVSDDGRFLEAVMADLPRDNEYSLEIFPRNYKRTGTDATDNRYIIFKEIVRDDQLPASPAGGASVLYEAELNASDTAKALAYDEWLEDNPAGDFDLFDQVDDEAADEIEALAQKLLANLQNFNYDSFDLETPPVVVGDDLLQEAQKAGQATKPTIADSTPPEIVSTIPAKDAVDQSLNPLIAVTFNEPLNPNTVSAATIIVKDASGLAIDGTIEYLGKVATFTPKTQLTKAAKYSVSVTTGVKDTSGNALAAEYTWSFSTADVTIDGPLPAGFTSFGFPVKGTSLTVSAFQATQKAGLILVNHTAGNDLTAQVSANPAPIAKISPRVTASYLYQAAMLTPAQAFQLSLREQERRMPRFRTGGEIRPRAAIRAAAVNDKHEFSTTDAADQPIKVPATLKKMVAGNASSNGLFFVDDTITDNVSAYLDNLGAAWPMIFTKTKAAFGDEPAAGAFNGLTLDGDITILIMAENRTKPGTAGFFWSGDLYPAAQATGSNERKIFYLIYRKPSSDADSLASEKGTLAHEFQHMINFYQRKLNDLNEDIWLNEAMSAYSEEVVGYGNPQTDSGKAIQSSRYLTNIATNSLIAWKGDNNDYGKAFIFSAWLGQSYANGDFRKLLTGKNIGTAAVAEFTGKSWDAIVSEYATALYVNEYVKGGLYGIKGLNLYATFTYAGGGTVTLPGPKMIGVSAYPAQTTVTVAPHAPAYIVYTGGTGSALNITLPAGLEAFNLVK